MSIGSRHEELCKQMGSSTKVSKSRGRRLRRWQEKHPETAGQQDDKVSF
jgi:hypothetical protein